jgi:hypothetical protein
MYATVPKAPDTHGLFGLICRGASNHLRPPQALVSDGYSYLPNLSIRSDTRAFYWVHLPTTATADCNRARIVCVGLDGAGEGDVPPERERASWWRRWFGG